MHATGTKPPRTLELSCISLILGLKSDNNNSDADDDDDDDGFRGSGQN